MKRHSSQPTGQILLFPPPAESVGIDDAKPVGGEPKPRVGKSLDIVISGSFRKDLPGLTSAFDELRDLGFRVLSPTNVNVVSEADGFVFMQGEETRSPASVELGHLEAIKRAAFVWLHAPEGYLGPSAALEIGFARATGIPVYSRVPLREESLRPLVNVVQSPHEAVMSFSANDTPPVPAVQAFQAYYARAAVQRGYGKESARDTLMLMLEEFGELARAIRKRHHLKRHGTKIVANEEQELADVFIYVVHMANILGIDLASAVQSKERLNIQRFLAR